MYRILDKEILAPGIIKWVVDAPLIAKKRKAGNFVIIRATSTGERIPLTIVDSNPNKGTIVLIIQAIGKTTHEISRMKKGDFFMDVVGPLGEPTPIKKSGTVACIAGGVGTAVIFPIAKALKKAGNKIITIMGARTKELVILEKEMAAVSDQLTVATDDGSYGFKGFVTGVLQEILQRKTRLDSVYAIGPLPMMKAVSEVTKKTGIPTWVSLNPLMMDGTGMCGACRVTVDGETKFACVDGPEFDGHSVNYDELISRNQIYASIEKNHMERYLKGDSYNGSCEWDKKKS